MVRPAGLARASAIVTMSVVAVFVVPPSASAIDEATDPTAIDQKVTDPTAVDQTALDQTAIDQTAVDLIPEHVATIYDYAAATAPCRVPFATLAGLGDVTSDHTRLGGTSRLLPDGDSEPTIVYERLDPAAPSGQLPDTDGGATDGTSEVDTTVGPMQFLPETWVRFGVDGNGDGTADPNNLWDAAASAANRLCEASIDSDVPGALTAYFGTDIYNDWVTESIAEAAAWQAVERPSPERREADVVSIAPAADASLSSGALTTPDDASTDGILTDGIQTDDTPTVDTPTSSSSTVTPSSSASTGEPAAGAADQVQVAGTEQVPAAAAEPGFIGPPAPAAAEPGLIGPPAPSVEAAMPLVAPGEPTVRGDWDGSGVTGQAVLTVADNGATISRVDNENRPYGRVIDVTTELTDPASLGGLAVGDWDGDGIDDLALLVAAPDGVTAIRFDRAGRVIDSANLGVLNDGATIVVGPAPVFTGSLGGEAPWKSVTAHDGTVLDLWKVGGIIIDVSLVEQTSAMLAAAAADGVTLEGWGWRSHDAQIELRRAHCADVWATPASECSPPTAVPGTSRHEYGTAIDFHSNTVAIGAGSPEFAWLAENAEDFGYFNLPSEPWHWSIDGG